METAETVKAKDFWSLPTSCSVAHISCYRLKSKLRLPYTATCSDSLGGYDRRAGLHRRLRWHIHGINAAAEDYSATSQTNLACQAL